MAEPAALDLAARHQGKLPAPGALAIPGQLSNVSSSASGLGRRLGLLRLGMRELGPGSRALLWMAASGALYCLLNALLRGMSLRMSAYQILTLVYAATLVVMLPVVVRAGGHHFRPRQPGGLVLRGAVHWLGMCFWLVAVSGITLAETTAIGFTTPLFPSWSGRRCS